MINASVIISFYNRVDYLKLVLAGLERQSFPFFEIIIADDGSDQKIIYEINRLSRNVSYKLTHLWHEKNGFRKNKILNKSIIASGSNYLIFIDGDCVPHPQFVKEHFENREERFCLTGRRVNLSKKYTEMLTPKNINNGFIEHKKIKLILDGIFGKSVDVEKGLYFKSEFFRDFFNKKKRGILGCNFSIYKSDLIRINGFDERYEAPSIGEDTDIQFRLEKIGIRIKSLNNIAVQYHLYHKLQDRPKKNIELFDQIKTTNKYFTPFGIEKTKIQR